MTFPLSENFVQFPVGFDPAPILDEIQALPTSIWQQHFFKEIYSIPLVDWVDQKMALLPILKQLPQISQLLEQLDAPLGQSRIMKLEPGAKVNAHVDLKHYWKHRLRIHFVIQTAPEALFGCADQMMHLPAGQIWVSNSWAPHWVQNNAQTDRIHIVIDTIGSPKVWQWLQDGWRSSSNQPPPSNLPILQPESTKLQIEKYHRYQKLHPAEVLEVLQDILADLKPTEQHLLQKAFQELYQYWQRHYLSYPQTYRWSFQQTLKPILKQIEQCNATLAMNQISVAEIVKVQLVDNLKIPVNLHKPIFIIGAPRTGIFQLHTHLAKHRNLWSLHPSPFDPFDQLDTFHPTVLKSQSNWIPSEEITSKRIDRVHEYIADALSDHQNFHWLDLHTRNLHKKIRWLFTSSKNAFRIPLLQKLFPDAQFICLWDQPQHNIHVILEGWKSKNFITYPDLEHWRGRPWSFVLPPDWQNLPAGNLSTIAIEQYRRCNLQILKDIQNIPKNQVLHLQSNTLQTSPHQGLQEICKFIEEPFGSHMQNQSLQSPKIEQSAWLHNAIQLMPILPQLNSEYREWMQQIGISQN